jgi:hypothetical protein
MLVTSWSQRFALRSRTNKILRQALAEWRLTKDAHPVMGAARTYAP